MKLRNVNKVIYTLVIIFVVLSYQTSFSKNYSGTNSHLNDWYELLGIDVKASKELSGDNCFKTIQDQIDKVYKTEFYEKKLKRKDKFDKFHPGINRHRLFFHWGFSIDPCRSAALNEQIKLLKLSDKERTEFCDIFREEQARRNRIMINAVRNCMGLPRTQSSALATLIYNVHILGDYETELVGALADTNLIHADNKNAIKRMNFDYNDVKMIFDNLDKAYASALGEKDRAQNIMMVLKRDFPPLLYKRWKNTLGFNDIVLQEPKSSVANNNPSVVERSMMKLKKFFNF